MPLRLARAILRMRLVRFGMVGCVGLVVDIAILYTLAPLGLGWIVGRLFSYLGAASATWFCNRRFTFAVTVPPSLREWARFVAANSLGGGVNYAVYCVLLRTTPLVAAHPALGVAIGSLAGMVVNFALSARLVFGRS